MPNLSKPKKIKKTKKLTNLPLATKSNKSKSPHAYYCCCAEKTKSGLPKGTKITQLTSHCKNQAPALMKAKQQLRETEKKKIVEH
jgi:hypothetical protein